MKVSAISGVEPNIDLYSLHKVLTSNKISDYDKMIFLRRNQVQISHMMETKISSNEFVNMMQGRALIRFRPIKNSYTKWGDKILLAKTLNILPSQVGNYVKNVSDALNDINQFENLSMYNVDAIKTYVFRHGTRPQVVAFLDYELKKAKDIGRTLHDTLNYGTGGVADYFVRPIHRLTNKTLIDIYNVIDRDLRLHNERGFITDAQKQEMAEMALVRICNIQHNNRFINAVKNDMR